ncbi:hypothetical protein [Streptomyces noursei]|uniref:hypothetical protein n=1 Tax=Streptomyces noursei TaxID=1971 RepID=UPI00068C23CF|nr:hypothetical protein [Streptomyces noursei]
MSPTAPHPRRPRSDPQASHSTCGDTPADSDAEPLPGTGERAPDDAAAVDDPAAPAAPDDFGESFGDSGDGPDACAPPAGDAGPPDGPAGGALGTPGAGALGGDDGWAERDGEGCAGPAGLPGRGPAVRRPRLGAGRLGGLRGRHRGRRRRGRLGARRGPGIVLAGRPGAAVRRPRGPAVARSVRTAAPPVDGQPAGAVGPPLLVAVPGGAAGRRGLSGIADAHAAGQ